MAVRDEVKAERAKMKDKPVKEKLAYFWEYYKIHTIVVLALLLVASSIAHSVLSNHPDALNAVFVNSDATDDGGQEELIEKVGKAAGISQSAWDINIDLFRTLTLGGPSNQTDFGTASRFQAQMQDQGLDVMVLDPWYFTYYTQRTTFMDLRDILTEDELKALEGRIYYVDLVELKKIQKEMSKADYQAQNEDAAEVLKSELRENYKLPDKEKMQEPAPVGISLSGSGFIKKHKLYEGVDPILGFVNTMDQKHKKAAKEMLKELLK
ncbi:MAG: hypothetical protein IIU28_02020 [Lachnospiraceae bacterium]|nr:hypothetical protein [Lachnospiraceae bacterium]